MKLVAQEDAKHFVPLLYRGYVDRFAAASRDLLHTMESFGLPVESEAEAHARLEATALLRKALKSKGTISRNDGKSLVWGPLSPACARCRSGVRSVSTFLSLACDRQCWFCFNPNQHDFDRYRLATKDWQAEVDDLESSLGGLDFLALTGGEPLLYPEETLAFVRHARELSPQGHVRLYTSGAQVAPSFMEELSQAGLDEIRFSVKLDEPAECQQRTFELMRAAQGAIPSVMVEMPVFPETEQVMNDLLQTLDNIGIFGINLLELCFPLHNAEAFRKRGLKLVRNPYKVPYSYGYAGALPVAGSEETALRIMRTAIERDTQLSLHWCSLENKNTAQIFEQNKGGAFDIPPYRFSQRSFFYEVVRAFGDDVSFCLSRVETAGLPFETDETGQMIAFDPAALNMFSPRDASEHVLWLASAVIEADADGRERFREVGLARIEPTDLSGGCLTSKACELEDDGTLKSEEMRL